jgi:3-phosphoshikimate 1-carboxyvinyltransferase
MSSLTPLQGKFQPPADKSLTHRYLFFAALTGGHPSVIHSPLIASDTKATINAIISLGCQVVVEGNSFKIYSPSNLNLTPQTFDCMNSGTTARHLIALLASIGSLSTITGDESLSKRDMSRMTGPLTTMGASFDQTHYLPLVIKKGIEKLQDISMTVPSAQVKSSLLLASIFHPGRFQLSGNLNSRDHTENFFKTQNGLFEKSATHLSSQVKFPFKPFEVTIPGDPSSAAFMIAAALLVPGSKIVCENHLLNKTRIGFLDVLMKSQANIKIEQLSHDREPIGRVSAAYTPKIHALDLSQIPLSYVIDEIPILSLVALFAEKTSIFSGLSELKHKESNRILSILELHQSWGCFETKIDGDQLIIRPTKKIKNHSHYLTSDHRIAMARAVGNYLQSGVLEKMDPCISVSYPNFHDDFKSLVI